MNFNFLLLATALVLAHQSLAEKQEYHDYKVYRLTPNSNEALTAIRNLESLDVLSFWTPVTSIGAPIDVLVAPKHVQMVEELVKNFEIDMKIIMSNVQERIDGEGFRAKADGDFGWDAYHTVDETNAWLDSLVKKYPDQVTPITVGTTYEKRAIKGVKVSFSDKNAKKIVFLEGNIHAREWITSAVVTYILNELLTSTDAKVRALAESHDWIVVPVFNVDGKIYTETKDRLWRKTRVPYENGCFGVDPNRNWGFKWNQGGSSSNPCSETYGGPNAFSEPSTKSISEYIATLDANLEGYVAFHSYSQLLLIPYGDTNAHVENYDELMEIGLKSAKSLARRYATRYTVGNIVDTIYVASGGSMDWVKGTYQTPITYTYELRDTGRYGFLLPADQIIPTALETLDSLVTMFEEYDTLHPHT